MQSMFANDAVSNSSTNGPRIDLNCSIACQRLSAAVFNEVISRNSAHIGSTQRVGEFYVAFPSSNCLRRVSGARFLGRAMVYAVPGKRRSALRRLRLFPGCEGVLRPNGKERLGGVYGIAEIEAT